MTSRSVLPGSISPSDPVSSTDNNGLPGGWTAIVEVTADQGSITTEVDVTSASLSFTAVTGRRYKHTVRAMVSNTTAAAACGLYICDGSSTHLDRGVRHVVTGGDFETLCWSWVESGLTSGSKTRKLRASTAAGAMALQNADTPLQYTVEDIGAV